MALLRLPLVAMIPVVTAVVGGKLGTMLVADVPFFAAGVLYLLKVMLALRLQLLLRVIFCRAEL